MIVRRTYFEKRKIQHGKQIESFKQNSRHIPGWSSLFKAGAYETYAVQTITSIKETVAGEFYK